MFSRVAVIGRGRVGAAVAARLDEQGLLADQTRSSADLVLLCVPDAAIAEVAARLPRWSVGRARQRRHAACGADSARSAFQRASAADVHQGARAPSKSTARGRPSPARR